MNIRTRIYAHFKGKRYEALGVAGYSETPEEPAVYQGLYCKLELRVRPAAMFLEEAEFNGERVTRFRYVMLGRNLFQCSAEHWNRLRQVF